MASAGPEHQPNLDAETKSVEDLVALVRDGHVRIPSFQRELNWQADDVRLLFDSIYKGYPIGSPLLWQGKADAGHVELGPLMIDAPETTAALWVVDGQQRLVALTAALSRPDPYPTSTRDDPFVVYFDPERRSFHTPRREEDIQGMWVPVSRLADSADLSEWIFNWSHAGDRKLRAALFEASRNIREYRVPLYVVRTNDQVLLREIFYRVNKSGKHLKWEDVHRALFPEERDSDISTLDDLAEELARLKMGKPDSESQLLPCMLAIRGRDVTQNLSVHYRNDPEVLRGAVSEALPSLRRTLSFLRRNCRIPHLRLLPRSTELIILARFFALHPEPQPRTASLLVRWTWRNILNAQLFDERTLRRRAVAAIIEGDEEASVQQLLKLVPAHPPQDVKLPDTFDARAAGSRIVLLALASLKPRELPSSREVDVAKLISSSDADAFRKVVARCEGERRPANRVIHPGRGLARHELLEHIQKHGNDTAELRSHAISSDTANALIEGDVEGFLEGRAARILETLDELGRRLAGWGRNDRPSIEYVLQQARES